MLEWYVGLQLERYIPQISTVLIATLLAVFGERINGALRKRVRKFHIAVRFLSFIGFWVFIFPFILLLATQIAIGGLTHVPGPWVAPFGLMLAVLICMAAYREKQI